MSLNAIHVHTMLFSNDKRKAKEKVMQLIKESGEEIVREYPDTVMTSNKRYTIRPLLDNARGYRYMEVYIDEELKSKENFKELFSNIIAAKLVPPHYYKDVEKDEEYNWEDHIHYF